MRWYVDISSIGAGSPGERHCVEAEQWQKALQAARAKRGDDAPFGNFSIELLDDGYRAIDPVSRVRYVVQRAADDAALTTDPIPVPSAPERERAARPRAARGSSRGRERRGRAEPTAQPATPVESAPQPAAAPAIVSAASTEPKAHAKVAIPDDPVPRPNGAGHAATPQAQARPMQAATAFERMTGGAAVPLEARSETPPSKDDGGVVIGAVVTVGEAPPPSAPPPSAPRPQTAPRPPSAPPVARTQDVVTEVLPAFKILSRRSQDPTPQSPLTYREMALMVAESTSLRDAEAILRAQFEVLRNSLSGAPAGKFIQLAVFDHEFAGRPKRPPLATLAFKDWRTSEPELAFPAKDAPIPPSAPHPGPAPALAVVPPGPAPALVPVDQRVTEVVARLDPHHHSAPLRGDVTRHGHEDISQIVTRIDAQRSAAVVEAPAPSAPPAAPSAPPAAPSAPPAAPSAPPAAPSAPPAAPSAPPAAPTPIAAAPSAPPAAPLAPSSRPAAIEDVEPIRPSPVIAITDAPLLVTGELATHQGPTLLEPIAVEPAAAEPAAAEPAAPEPAALEPAALEPAAAPEPPKSAPPAPKSAPPAPKSAPPAPAPSAKVSAVPAPTPSEIRRNAADMADDEEATLSVEPPVEAVEQTRAVPPPAPSAEWIEPEVEPDAPPGPTVVPGSVPPKARSVPPPPPVRTASVPPAKPASIPPPASVGVSSVAAPDTEVQRTSVPGGAAPTSAARPSAATPPQGTPRASAPGSAPLTNRPATHPAVVVKRLTNATRKAGDDLITDLFEACSDLSFVHEPLEGAEFVINLVFENIPSLVVLVSFFDINTREFVVVRQGITTGEGEQLGNAVLTRASEFVTHLGKAMRVGRAAVLAAPATDALAEDARWRALTLAPASYVIAPVLAGGRFLGLIEAANPVDGSPFSVGDAHAITYIAERFGEFLAQREIVVDPDRVCRPKLRDLTRR
ncbi:MAG: hypothetical protein U0271_03400 [Polyangiaceae bacterium]